MSITITALIEKVRRLSAGHLRMTYEGNDCSVKRFAPPHEAQEGDIAFLTDPKYLDAMRSSMASVRVVHPKMKDALLADGARSDGILWCSNPYAFFAWATQVFFPVDRGEAGVSPMAYVDRTAQIDSTATIEPMAVVRAGAKIGARVCVKSGAYIDTDAVIGDDAMIYPNAYIGPRTQVGARSIIQPGAVVGASGFGFAPFEGRWVKIPQVGRVLLAEDVEVGSNTTIDCGALEDTKVGTGTKLDNQIQLGHNVEVGEHCVMASCVGIAGSTKVGDHCMIGGAAMINGHISIPSGSAVGPATAITGWSDQPSQKTGFFPALEGRDFQLTAAMVTRLPEMRKQIRALEREIARLKKLVGKES